LVNWETIKLRLIDVALRYERKNRANVLKIAALTVGWSAM